MLISTFPKLERRYTYTGEKNEPTMVINNHVRKRSAMIPLECAFKYNEPQNVLEVAEAAKGVMDMADHLGLDLNKHTLGKLREFIADGLDDLVKMPPFVKEQKAVAEFEATVDGQKFTGEVKE